MPRNKPVNPDQGTLLLPSRGRHEAIAPEENQFTQYAGLTAVQPLEQEKVVGNEEVSAVDMDVVNRKNLVHRALGALGAVAETATAVKADEDPAAKAALQQRFGAKYEEKVAKMKADNDMHQSIFDKYFEEMWGLEDVKRSGQMTETEIKQKFKEDKQHFVTKFSESESNSVHDAATNRGNYRRKLNRIETIYKRNNLGIWPNKPAKKTRRRRAA